MNEVSTREERGKRRIAGGVAVDDERHLDASRDADRGRPTLERGGSRCSGTIRSAARCGCRQDDDVDMRLRRNGSRAIGSVACRYQLGSSRRDQDGRLQQRVYEALIAGQVLTAPMKPDGTHHAAGMGVLVIVDFVTAVVGTAR
jgi:hypothetical protein